MHSQHSLQETHSVFANSFKCLGKEESLDAAKSPMPVVGHLRESTYDSITQ